MTHAINSQGLPQIGILLLNIQFLIGRRIKQSSDAPHRIDGETANFRGGAAEISLEQTTDKTCRESEVGKEIFYADSRGFRNNFFVTLCNRLKHQ
jgi:hypothetical protein